MASDEEKRRRKVGVVTDKVHVQFSKQTLVDHVLRNFGNPPVITDKMLREDPFGVRKLLSDYAASNFMLFPVSGDKIEDILKEEIRLPE